MATFLHRLCLFGLLATTGFALSNCQRQSADEEAMMREAAAAESVPLEGRPDAPPADALGTGGSGPALDAAPEGAGAMPVRK